MGLTTKIHMACDSLARPVRFLLAAGQSHDILAAPALIEGMAPQAVMADRPYDSSASIRPSLDGPILRTVKVHSSVEIWTQEHSPRREPLSGNAAGTMTEIRRILVTGGAGYIGSHTCKALSAAGYLPVAFDDLSNGHAEAVQWGPLVRGDVRNTRAVSECIQRHDISAVIHFAGLIEVGLSNQAPDVFWDYNLNGVAAVLAAMRQNRVKRIVFSSTAAVYGQPVQADVLTPLTETLPLQPINPYGDSKLAAERLIGACAKAYGLTGVALRYFNASGADPEGLIGEAHDPESHLIPLAIEAALGLGPPLTVFGADFPTPDGSCVRDYIHVSDLAQAHVLALDMERGEAPFTAMNLGVGSGRSVLEVIRAVVRATGRATPYRVGDRRTGDPASLVAAPDRARERLGWRPAYTDLDEIVRSAVAWRLNPRFGPHQAPSRHVA